MIYILSAFMLGAGFYTLTYGISLWKDEKNKLGGFGTIILAIGGTMLPLITLFLKR